MTESGTSDAADFFTTHRRYLFSVAYRMLGSAEDAEDILQDAWIRFQGVDLESIDHPRSYLVTIVTRLSVDLMRSARYRREEYVGIWLPEPVVTREALADDLVKQAESVSFAFLLLLERLNPIQRAALVLHDVLEYTHDEVAQVIGRTPAATRQLLRRARLKLGSASRPRAAPTTDTRRLVDELLEATRTGNVERLVKTLATDVVLMSDGGGHVTTINRPLVGSLPVARLLNAFGRQSPDSDAVVAELNGQPAVLVSEGGVLTNAFVFDVTTEGITAIYVVRNPVKLERLTLDAA